MGMRNQISGVKIVGRFAKGRGRGTHFTRLEWARRQFIDKLGIDPFPGTMNLIVDGAESMKVWERLKETPGIVIDNPNNGPNDCDARCYPVSINAQIEAAIVLPDVAKYSPDKVEIIAADGLSTALDLNDGDPLTLELR